MSEGKPFIKSGQLFERMNPFDEEQEVRTLFNDAMNEALRWHLSHCTDYKAFLAENGLVSEKESYLFEQIPPVLTDLLNNYKLVSVGDKQIKYRIISNTNFDSSDNKLILDARSYKRLLRIWENIFNYFGFVQPKQKCNYICFTYDSKYETELNENFYFDILTSLTAHRSVYYAVRLDKKNSKFVVDIESAAKKLIDYSCHAEPVRIIGTYYYINQICEWFIKNNVDLKLNKNSCAFIFNESGIISQTDKDLKNKIEKLFAVSEKNIKNIYINPNQGIPFIECKNGKYHIPIFAKVSVLDPETLLSVNDGEVGILCLMTPYITGYPAISILTTNKAVIENCDCGIETKTFKLLDAGI